MLDKFTASERRSQGGRCPDEREAGLEEEVSLTGVLSRYLVYRLGESKLVFMAAGFLIAGMIATLFGFAQESAGSLLLGLLMLAVSGVFFGAEDYYQIRKCEKCGRAFAFVEAGEPDVVEVGSKLMKTCYYRCKYCGHERVVVKKERIRKRIS